MGQTYECAVCGGWSCFKCEPLVKCPSCEREICPQCLYDLCDRCGKCSECCVCDYDVQEEQAVTLALDGVSSEDKANQSVMNLSLDSFSNFVKNACNGGLQDLSAYIYHHLDQHPDYQEKKKFLHEEMSKRGLLDE